MSNKTPKPRAHSELDPEDMTMHDIVWMFLSTGLLASGQFDNGNSAILYGKELANQFLKSREEEDKE
jgi:hypothetical protein